ncbi:asparagine synthase-related protein [Bacillus sp. AK128]
MSAIVGSINTGNLPINNEEINGLMSSLEKFPSDAVKMIREENYFLACSLQWITPESVEEELPYYSHMKKLAITSDAIIDNREELFESLQVKKEYRNNIPDSQLILLAYEKWGEESPKYLVGDFAFMIWDEKKQKLFGARDFSGARTLYYFSSHERFAFGTIIQPLLNLPYIKNEFNEEWLGEFLAIPWNFESIDTSSTVYNNIKQLPPSHSITVVNGRVVIKRYCTFNLDKKIKLKSNSEYEEAFLDVFKTAVKSRLRTHRNVGAHLSGGLDSGSVSSIAANMLNGNQKKLHTFSYIPVDGFKDWTPRSRVANEKPFIQSTVDYVGNIEPNFYSFDEKNPYSEIDDWLDTIEMPYKFFENSYWLSGIYEKAYDKDIGVLLNGQRGNWTVSWGPATDFQALLFKQLKWTKLQREISLYSRNLGVPKGRIGKLVRKKVISSIKNKFARTNDPNDSVFPMMINPNFAEKLKVYTKLQEQNVDLTGKSVTNSYEVRKLQFNNLYYWNINGTYSTKLSLRYKVWDRDPTNDLRVINFCLSVPENQYVQNGIDRSLIRRATKGLLPDNIRLNQKIRGIQGTDGIYRMTPNWNLFINELQEVVNDPLAKHYLNIPLMEQYIAKYKNGAKANDVFGLDFKMLMKSLIFIRFLRRSILGSVKSSMKTT